MRILYVDDEAVLCKAFARALRSKGTTVVTATSATEALSVLKDSTDDWDVVATDYRMPEMDGLELLKAAREHAPRAWRLLVTGQAHGELSARMDELAGAVDELVAKPWTLDDMRRIVGAAADRRRR